MEDLVGGAGEDARKRERQLEAGHVTIALDGVDALARDARGLGELFLGPAGGDAKFLDVIDDGRRHVKPTFQGRLAVFWNDVKFARHYAFRKP